MRQLLHKDLVNITASNSLRQFGGALIEVFVPLLLLQRGMSLIEVAGFYIAYAVIKLLINYQAMRLTNTYGARPSLIIARLSYIAYLSCLLLIVSGSPTSFVWIMAVALALTNAFQWNAEHAHISRVINMDRKGKDIALIESFNTIASSIAPAVAAVLALAFNTTTPLIVAIVCILASIFWLWYIDDEAGGHTKQEGLSYSLRFAPMRDLVANFAFNAHAAIGILVWPMYLAYVLSDLESIGTVTTIGSLAAALLLVFIGNRNDKHGTAKVLREGSYATFAAHLLRLAPVSLGSVIVINLFWILAIRYQHNAWVSTYYAHTRKYGMKYILSMEIACDAGYIATFAAVALCLYGLGYQAGFMVLFVGAAFISLLCNKITRTA